MSLKVLGQCFNFNLQSLKSAFANNNFNSLFSVFTKIIEHESRVCFDNVDLSGAALVGVSTMLCFLTSFLVFCFHFFLLCLLANKVDYYSL